MIKIKKYAITLFIVVATMGSLVTISYLIASYYGPADSATTTIWLNFWSVFNNVVLMATLLVVAYYTYETYHLRRATVDSNALSFRPILIFVNGAPFCTVQNKGYGPALNVVLIIWNGSMMKVTVDSAVPGIIPPGNDTYCFNNHIEIDSTGFKKRLPGFSSLISRINTTHHNLFCLTYRDLAGNRFYSIINGSNELKYDGVFEHGTITDA